ncbi:chemotaxis protein CheW [Brevibacillus sp. H7]|uniref:chemotaxis protein CheW n=1 Tax=Brevibacillus sp. H7 TaxID=3349138 RepID=UPI0037FAEF3A
MTQKMSSQKEVIFRIGSEEYGISVTDVVSIEKARETTPVPESSPYLLGMIDLRGTVIPIIDLSKIFGGAPIAITESTRYIVAQVEDQVVGFAVDAATDIIDVPGTMIQKPAIVQSTFIYGIAKLEERMIVLLDIPNLVKNLVGESIYTKNH